MEHSLHLTIYILPLGLTTIPAHGNFVAHVSWKLLFNSHSTFCFFLLLIGIFLVFLSIVKSIGEIREIPRFDDIEGPTIVVATLASTTIEALPLLETN
jgi:hypothetical protein